ncbi:MAG TPA: DUF3617 family protein [Casimicrobiaceae bacterium]|jgi:hypothetical protein|nr:DUF3617 family protein [Casimicrobiaceae bacterium]
MNTRKRSTPRACAGIVLAFALAASLPASAQGKDDLWEVSTKMEMAGMPMAMPAQTNRFCIGKNRKDEEFVPKQGDCRMVESKRVGNKFTYKMDCAGNAPATVDGAITFANNTYDGQMRMTMKQTNHTMDITFTGKRIGDCAAATK